MLTSEAMQEDSIDSSISMNNIQYNEGPQHALKETEEVKAEENIHKLQ